MEYVLFCRSSTWHNVCLFKQRSMMNNVEYVFAEGFSFVTKIDTQWSKIEKKIVLSRVPELQDPLP